MNRAQGALNSPVMGIVGWSGSGKTTLIARIIPLLRAAGLRLATIKHAHHGFELDRPGKDSHTHRLAGAAEVMLVSDRRWALLHETPDAAPPNLPDLLFRMAPADLVLVEGFRGFPHPRIEVFRPGLGKPPPDAGDPALLAVVSDAPLPLPVPVLDLDAPAEIAAFIRRHARPLPA